MSTKRYNIGAVKIAQAERDIAHSIPLRGYLDLIGSDVPDDDDQFPVGAHTTYSRDLTEEEAEHFRTAQNCRYVEEDSVGYPAYGVNMPRPVDRNWSGYPAEEARWHGRDVIIAVCDSGVGSALKTYMNWTVVASGWFYNNPAPAEVWGVHGSLCASLAVPYGGRIIDANVSADTTQASNESTSVVAFKFCVDNGARIISYSHYHNSGGQAFLDAFAYGRTYGAEFYACSGNNNVANINYPATMAPNVVNLHAVGAFDTATNARSDFSNHDTTLSGVAPGTNIACYDQNANYFPASGTSMSTPLAASICARLTTGGRFTAAQAAAAMDANGRKTGAPAIDEGNNGAYDFTKALTALGGFAPDIPLIPGRNTCPNPSCASSAVGWSYSGSSSFSGRVTGAASTDRPTGYNMTRASATGDAWIQMPQTAVHSTLYSGQSWAITYQIFTSQTCSSNVQVYSFNSTGAQIGLQESALTQRAAGGITRANFVVTLPVGTVRIRAMHKTVSQPINSYTQIFAVRYAPSIVAISYADGNTFAWDWDDGDVAGIAASGEQTYGTGLIVY